MVIVSSFGRLADVDNVSPTIVLLMSLSIHVTAYIMSVLSIVDDLSSCFTGGCTDALVVCRFQSGLYGRPHSEERCRLSTYIHIAVFSRRLHLLGKLELLLF